VRYQELTDLVLKGYYTVYNSVPRDLDEVLYRRALQIELRRLGLTVRAEVPFIVRYRGEVIGMYRADQVVNDLVIVELKQAERLRPPHRLQLAKYLRIAELQVGLLLNFGDRAEIIRVDL
jgi:GxxExxY protein